MSHPPQNPKVLFAIVTCKKNKNRQEVLKKTWTQEIPNEIDWVFVQGGERDIFNLAENSLTLKTLEGYRHLARKTYDLVSYVYKNTEYDYVVKIDDDAYVRVKNLMSFILEHHPDYAGKKNIQEYSDRELAYAQGGCYVLSRRSMQIVSDFQFEDGEGSPWWYGGQADNFLWKGVSDEVKMTTSVEDIMVADILERKNIYLQPSHLFLDRWFFWKNFSIGKVIDYLFIKIARDYFVALHPVTMKQMEGYYHSIKKFGYKKGFFQKESCFLSGVFTTFAFGKRTVEAIFKIFKAVSKKKDNKEVL